MSGWDPYLDLESGVLRNRLGITDAATLADVEAQLSAVAVTELALTGLPGDYDLPHLQAFHQRIFGDVYPWAGRLRTVSLGKNGQMFCPPHELEQRAGQVFLGLAVRDRLCGLRRAAFLDELTEFYAALTFLHPFREGNGRTQRAFLAQLARGAGHRLSWAGMDREENTIASRAANTGELGRLRALLDPLLLS